MANFVLPNSGAAYVAGGTFDEVHGNRIQSDLDLLVNGDVARNRFLGGSDHIGIRGSAAVDILNGVRFKIDNTSTQWSGSSGITVQIVLFLRVADASISVTPRVYNVTAAGVASTTGAAACAATARDWSGSNQIQTLVLTLASGVNDYVVQVTPTAATYAVFAKAWLHLYI
jgi:hypothetical protein